MGRSLALRTWGEFIAVCIVVLVLGVAVLMFRQNANAVSEIYKDIHETMDIVVALKKLKESFLEAESAQKSYVLTERDEYLIPFTEQLNHFEERVNHAKSLRSEFPEQVANIDKLLSMLDSKLSHMRKSVNLVKKNKDRLAMKYERSEDVLQLKSDIYDLFRVVEEYEQNILDGYLITLQRSENRDADIALLFAGVSLCTIVIALWTILKIKKVDHNYREELEARAAELEEKVQERTKELEIYTQELNRSNRELEEFAFVASHDLQEPLRKIQAFAQRIQDVCGDQLTDKPKDYLRRLSSAAARMSTLIEDLLKFSRIKTRGKPLESLSLNVVLDEVLEDMELAISESEGKVEVGELPTVDADATQLRQLFTNLLSNAIKFRREGVPPEVVISSRNTEMDNGTLGYEITVQDNGIGFDQSYAEKIFLPFQRLHSRDEYKGTGIGLPICRRIVERHGGEIVVNSVPGEGTCFVITLPESYETVENLNPKIG